MRQRPKAAPQYGPVLAGERAGDTGKRNKPRIPSRSGLAAGTNHPLVRARTCTPTRGRTPKKYPQKAKCKNPFILPGRSHGTGTLRGHLEEAQGHLAPLPRGFGVVGAAPQSGGDSRGLVEHQTPPKPRCCGCLQHPPADSSPGAVLTNVHQLTPRPPSATLEAAGAPRKEELDGLGSIQGLGMTPWG